eukprot:SAG11_NODE_3666_length_2300_cov_1.850522_3_plen_118_part_00
MWRLLGVREPPAASASWALQSRHTEGVLHHRGRQHARWARARWLCPQAAVAAVEGAYQIATGALRSLSEQQLLDCSNQGGCLGGVVPSGFNYMIVNKVAIALVCMPPWKYAALLART